MTLTDLLRKSSLIDEYYMYVYTVTGRLGSITTSAVKTLDASAKTLDASA